MGIKTLLISPAPTHPPDAGNRMRILQLSKQLRAGGSDLYFAYYDHEAAGGDFRGMRRFWGKKGIFPSENTAKTFFRLPKIFGNSLSPLRKEEYLRRPLSSDQNHEPKPVDIWNNPKYDELLLSLHSQVHFQLVWVEYVFLSGILSRFDSSVTKVIDTHDIFSDRHKMFLANRTEPEWFYTSREIEKLGLSRGDLVVAIKDGDAQFFRNLGLPNVTTIGHFFPVQSNRKDDKKERACLFLGSDNASNVKAWQFFSESILEKTWERIPGISFHVAGRICHKIPDSPRYYKHGVVSDLNKIYRSVTVAINPVTFGTGLKIKSIEPLAFGCPVVTTPVGIEGIEDAENQGILVSRNPGEFVSHLESLLKNSNFYEEQRQRGRQYMARYNAQNQQRLLNVLRQVRKKTGR
jgi:glycosyltransferase involved in cell wall biosynthesis